jgi:hypothetical protein
MSYFTNENKKSIDSKNPEYVQGAMKLRRKYHVYSLQPYRFLAVNCDKGHFFVASIVFDMEQDNPFSDVYVYDSFRKSGRRNEKPLKNTPAGAFLMAFQQFLLQFCVFSTKHNETLLLDPEFILRDCKYENCPQQHNFYDCGLFSLATLLHLVDNCPSVNNDAFTQQDISKLRTRLYSSLSNNEPVDWNFMCQFFPRLKPREKMEGDPLYSLC